MKAFRVEVLVLGFENETHEQIRYHLGERVKYLSTRVMSVEEAEIGEWSDEHPLNQRATSDETYRKLFG